MAPEDSYLSHERYLYDVVVATTQAAVNSGLLTYLSRNPQPPSTLCFVAGDENQPVEISLEELLKLTGGVSPFDVPADTPFSDQRVQKLYGAAFMCGIKIQMGLPPGVRPANLPAPIVDLKAGAKQVEYNMYCSEMTVIELQPGIFGKPGKWNVYEQPSGSPWYVQTNVNITTSDLDKNLDTPYFNNHPEEKEALLDQLKNLSGTAFSLQQLLFELSTAILQTVPSFVGIPKGSNAEYVVNRSFIDVYSANAKEKGYPILAVNAVSKEPDPSNLQMVAIEKMVNPVLGSDGQPIKLPTPQQANANTLNYLCATGSSGLPIAAQFNWNWLETSSLDTASGVMAVNRTQIGSFLLDQLKEFARAGCIGHSAWVEADWYGTVEWHWSLWSGEMPQGLTITYQGPNVAQITYEKTTFAEDKADVTNVYGAIEFKSSYKCVIALEGSSIKVTQDIQVYNWIQYLDSSDDFWPVRRTNIDTYDISVDSQGNLVIGSPRSDSKNNDEEPDAPWYLDFFYNFDDMQENIQDSVVNFGATRLRTPDLASFKNFIFPGGKVFTYKSAQFSDHQDLCVEITYVNTDSKSVPATHPIKAPQPPPTLPSFGLSRGKSSSAKKKPQKAPKPRFTPRLGNVSILDGKANPKLKSQRTANNIARTISSSLKLGSSCELMDNYIQGQILSPQEKFDTAQTADGYALLFVIDTSGVFRTIQERPSTQTGWVSTDLSSDTIKNNFPGAIVDTFDVGQSARDGSISLAMAVELNKTDHLYLSLSNSNSDTSWITKPEWTYCPFDAPDKPSQLSVVGIMFSETESNEQLLVVDIDRSSDSSTKHIERYHISTIVSSSGPRWVRKDVPIDIESGNYQSVIGRAKKELVDGIYTAGAVGNFGQLVYVPIINWFSDVVPPAVTRLSLPGRAIPTAIAATRDPVVSSPNYILTDLYAIGGKTLYRFSAENSGKNDAIADTIVTYDTLSGTDTLIAMTHEGVTYLWGKNASNVVYYLSCETSKIDNPGSWSAPVPILVGIERISAYVNRTDGGNTIFAAGGGKFYRLTQATDTSSKLWQVQNISLEAPPTLPAHAISSYTTTLKVTGEDDLPVKDARLSITAQTRVPVYIDGLYYVLGQVPIEVTTGPMGTVTLFEVVDSIYATVLAVSVNDGPSTAINPMDTPFAKLAALNDKDSLKAATFPTNTQAGGVLGPTERAPLVSGEVSDHDLEVIADNMKTFKSIYDGSNSRRLRMPLKHAARVVPANPTSRSRKGGSSRLFGINISMGDIWQWLKSGVEAIISIVKDVAEDIWHFVAEIAGEVYHAVIDTVEAVMAAIEWVFDVIKTAIEDIIQFIKFLFEWDDIKRTKDVLHNLAILFFRNNVQNLRNAKGVFDRTIMGVEETISEWAGIEDWSPLGEAASLPPTENGSDPAKDQTAGSQLLADHYRNNAGNLSLKGSEPSQDVVQMLIDELLEAIENQGAVLSAVYQQLVVLGHEFASMTVAEVLKRLAGILANSILSSVQVVGDALFNVLADLSDMAIDLLNTKIHIPVISDILNFIGIEDISFLDLFSWIAAVAYTVVYKIANDEAPFPDNTTTKALISAKSWAEVTQQFSRSQSGSKQVAFQDLKELPETSKAIYIAGHAISGFMTLVGSFVSVFEAASETGENPFSMPGAVISIIGGVFGAIAETLVPMCPIDNEVVSDCMLAVSSISIASKVVFSGWLQKKLAKAGGSFQGLVANDGRATGAVIDAVLVIPQLFGTCWHFCELAKKPEGAPRSAAIVGEVSSLCSYVGRVSYAVAVNDKNPETKFIEIGIMVVGNTGAGGCETAVAFIL